MTCSSLADSEPARHGKRLFQFNTIEIFEMTAVDIYSDVPRHGVPQDAGTSVDLVCPRLLGKVFELCNGNGTAPITVTTESHEVLLLTAFHF